MRRLSWLLRIAFHDWMWEGGHRPDLARRMARALPLYFSDPYAVDLLKHESDVVGWTSLTFSTASASLLRQVEPTTTFSVGTTVNYRYGD